MGGVEAVSLRSYWLGGIFVDTGITDWRRRIIGKPQIPDHLFVLLHQMESTANASHSHNPCDLTLPEFVIYFYVQPSICLIGFLLSVINCQVFRKPIFVGPEYKMMIALSATDAITLLSTFPLGFQRWVTIICFLN